jgi:hypothetical protein
VKASPRPSPGESGRGLLLLALLAVTFLLGCFPMGDFDVWWHLRSGQLILERGAVPRVDLFTYTNSDRPWIDLYWLFQIVIALLYRVGGASALVLLKAVVGVALVALTCVARGKGARAWPVVLAWLPAVVMLSGRLCERPELASLLFVAGFLTVLQRAAERPRWLLLLPAMQLLWVNCHGFFVLGPLLLAAYAAAWLYDRLRPPATPAVYPPARLAVPVGAATLLACLCNPYGPGVFALPIEQSHKLGATGVYRATIGELKTVGDFIAQSGPWNPYLLAFFAVLALGVTSFVMAGRRGRVHPFRLLIFAAAAYLGWQATRNSALFAVVAVFVIAGNFDDLLANEPAVTAAKASARSRGAPLRKRPPNPNFPNFALLVAVLALGLFTLLGVLYAWAGEGRTVGLGERKHWYAHGGCTFLARPDLPERIVAYNLGQAAVCIAHAAPLHKVFMDPRLEVNTEATYVRYLAGLRKLWRDEPGWESELGIDYGKPAETPALLIERGVLGRAANNLMKDTRWRLVYVDDVAGAFVTRAYAEAHGLPEARQ